MSLTNIFPQSFLLILSCMILGFIMPFSLLAQNDDSDDNHLEKSSRSYTDVEEITASEVAANSVVSLSKKKKRGKKKRKTVKRWQLHYGASLALSYGQESHALSYGLNPSTEIAPQLSAQVALQYYRHKHYWFFKGKFNRDPTNTKTFNFADTTISPEKQTLFFSANKLAVSAGWMRGKLRRKLIALDAAMSSASDPQENINKIALRASYTRRSKKKPLQWNTGIELYMKEFPNYNIPSQREIDQKGGYFTLGGAYRLSKSLQADMVYELGYKRYDAAKYHSAIDIVTGVTTDSSNDRSYLTHTAVASINYKIVKGISVNAGYALKDNDGTDYDLVVTGRHASNVANDPTGVDCYDTIKNAKCFVTDYFDYIRHGPVLGLRMNNPFGIMGLKIKLGYKLQWRNFDNYPARNISKIWTGVKRQDVLTDQTLEARYLVTSMGDAKIYATLDLSRHEQTSTMTYQQSFLTENQVTKILLGIGFRY